MLEEIRIRKASESDFEEIDRFDVLGGYRKAEIQKGDRFR